MSTLLPFTCIKFLKYFPDENMKLSVSEMYGAVRKLGTQAQVRVYERYKKQKAHSKENQ